MATISDPFVGPAFPEREHGPEAEHGTLAGIAARLADIAAQLQQAAATQTGSEPDPAPDSGPVPSSIKEAAAFPPDDSAPLQRSALAMARHAYWLRRQRTQIFGSGDLFGEPAWDILLDLYIAHAEGKPVSVSSACIGSASPATTGLRWLSVLADHDLIAREADRQDQRRIMVTLTRRGIAAMERFLTMARGR